ncbi:hypothetical protein [Prescottella sp. R16]|uniref:hypothetical protein n=1 Tax=Prescottella sp. R16 TaxID=3064529 RepID=UPI00272ECC52|nr:hypothetical protein [Prescottella sp. R16]
MPSDITVDALIEEIDHTPYGPEERDLIERAITLAEETGDEAAAYAVRMRLVQSASMTGDTEALLTAFAWCVGRNAADPATFPTQVDDYDLLWFHKWIADALGSNPMFPQATIAESIDRMEATYRQAGVGLSGVVQTRFWEAFESGRIEEAGRYLEELARTPRDDYSHCEACVRSEEAAYRFASGDLEAGLTLVEEMLDEGMSCGEEPERAMAHTLLPLLETGRLDEAEQMHVRGYRLARGNADNIGMVGRHLVFLSVTGNEQRALEMLERHLGWLGHDGLNASAHLDALTAFAVACTVAARAGLGGERVRGSDAASLRRFVGDHDGLWTVEEFGHACHRAAEELAARFDDRNGNEYRSETLTAAMTLVDRRWDLPIGGAHTVATGPVVVAPEASAAFADDVTGASDVVAHVESLQNDPDDTDGTAVLDWIGAELESTDAPGRRTVLLRLRAQILAGRGRFAEALASVDAALALSVAHAARSVTAPLAALSAHIAGDLGEAEDAIARMRLAKQEAELAGIGTSGPRYHLGVMLTRAGRPDEAVDELTRAAEIETADGVGPESLAQTRWWLGCAHRDNGDTRDAVAAWTECVALARSCDDHATAATAGKDLGVLLVQVDDPDGFAVLDAAVADAERVSDRPDVLVDVLHVRGRVRCSVDDAAGLDDLRVAAELADGWTRADIADSTARALAQLRRDDDAVAAALSASDAYADAGDVAGSAGALLVAAQVLARSDRHEDVLAVLADARTRAPEVPQLAIRVALMEGDAFEALGRHDEAAAARARLDD